MRCEQGWSIGGGGRRVGSCTVENSSVSNSGGEAEVVVAVVADEERGFLVGTEMHNFGFLEQGCAGQNLQESSDWLLGCDCLHGLG